MKLEIENVRVWHLNISIWHKNAGSQSLRNLPKVNLYDSRRPKVQYSYPHYIFKDTAFDCFEKSKFLQKLVSYGKLVTYMNDRTSLRNVRQIRQTEYPEHNLGNIRTSQINIYLALLVKHHKCFEFPYFVNNLTLQTNLNKKAWFPSQEVWAEVCKERIT